MGICAQELREFVIQPVLTHLGEKGERARSAVNLLLGTAAQESGLGYHLKVERARGLGIYQITPQTHINIWDKYLIDDPVLASAVRGLASQHEFLSHPHAELATNLSYATAVAWMVYRRQNKTLPQADDIAALGRFWARNFHHRPTDRAGDYVTRYKEFVGKNDRDLAA